jgi:hypothetical protein
MKIDLLLRSARRLLIRIGAELGRTELGRRVRSLGAPAGRETRRAPVRLNLVHSLDPHRVQDFRRRGGQSR